MLFGFALSRRALAEAAVLKNRLPAVMAVRHRTQVGVAVVPARSAAINVVDIGGGRTFGRRKFEALIAFTQRMTGEKAFAASPPVRVVTAASRARTGGVAHAAIRSASLRLAR